MADKQKDITSVAFWRVSQVMDAIGPMISGIVYCDVKANNQLRHAVMQLAIYGESRTYFIDVEFNVNSTISEITSLVCEAHLHAIRCDAKDSGWPGHDTFCCKCTENT